MKGLVWLRHPDNKFSGPPSLVDAPIRLMTLGPAVLFNLALLLLITTIELEPSGAGEYPPWIDSDRGVPFPLRGFTP